MSFNNLVYTTEKDKNGITLLSANLTSRALFVTLITRMLKKASYTHTVSLCITITQGLNYLNYSISDYLSKNKFSIMTQERFLDCIWFQKLKQYVFYYH